MVKRILRIIVVLVSMGGFVSFGYMMRGTAGEPPTLWNMARELRAGKMVDLTHAFYPEIPHFDAFPSETVEPLFTYEKDGFLAERFNLVGQWGTHVDPPSHFHKGLKSVDEIALQDMVLPLVVIDVHEKVKENADYVLSVDDVIDWEKRHGAIPEGAFVAMRTDWSLRWPDAKAMSNCDRKVIAHYPGWGLQALRFLYENRNIAASGHETTDTDPGIKTSTGCYEAESYVLSTNHYQIELLTNLDKVPEYGALAICTFPKPRGGSGFPARIFAIVP